MAQTDVESCQKLFVLGVERSGSTWLANILDSAPSVELIMEPFTEVADIFRGFPSRLTYLDSAIDPLADRIESQLHRLPELKYFGLEDRTSPGWLRRLNWWAQESRGGLIEALGGRRSAGRRMYRALNLGRHANGEVFSFDKSVEPSTFALKEVRLNLKVGFLDQLFPDAKYVVIIRNPLSQAESIERQFARGSIDHLRKRLDGALEAWEDSRRLAPFVEAVEAGRDDRWTRIIAYWFANYSVLLEDLEARGGDYTVVRHEELSRQPTETTRRLFEFARVDWNDQTASYLAESTSGGSSSNQAVTDTKRQTQGLVERSLERLTDEQRRVFWEVAEPFWPLAPDPVADYHDWLKSAL